ncbi:AraC family transcriptional regulator [Pseudonocardia alni subsp. carboxydivorans]|uniref:AraC family transcriptional regulator n=1 Tax=Pseudonocardia alni subsp. carboxydivorans TaxID=415010 RepID=A0ABU9A9Z8_PSEA5
MSAEYVPGRPPAALRGHVLRYLGYREHAAAPLRRRQPPSAGTALILGLHPLTLSGPAVATGSAAAFVGGLSDTWVLTEFTGPQAGVQVDLTPAATYTLLGGRALPGGTVPRLDELDDPVLASLPARLAAEPTWDRLSATAGRVGVAELAAETGWSRRHLQSRFRSQVGLTPGTVRRVLRFARAAELVGGGRDPLALVAAECGYADQPHLSREFRALAGISPAAFRAEQFPFLHDAPPRPGQDRSS